MLENSTNVHNLCCDPVFLKKFGKTSKNCYYWVRLEQKSWVINLFLFCGIFFCQKRSFPTKTAVRISRQERKVLPCFSVESQGKKYQNGNFFYLSLFYWHKANIVFWDKIVHISTVYILVWNWRTPAMIRGLTRKIFWI